MLSNPEYDRLPVKIKPNGLRPSIISDTDGVVLGTDGDGYTTPKLLESELGQAETARIKWLKNKRGIK